jgi:hypothetical protein
MDKSLSLSLPPHPKQRSTKDDAQTRAHLEAYMAAFMGTDAEVIEDFEKAGIEALIQATNPTKR